MKKRLLTILTGIVMIFGIVALAACNTKDTDTKYKVIYLSGAESATGTAPAEAYYAEGYEFTIAENAFTNEGFTFAGWNDGTATYEAGATYTMPAKAITFTAQWTKNTPPTPKEIKISFDMNGHGAQIADRIATDGKITAPQDPTDADYEFGGWFTTKECTGTAIDFENATFEASATVYAKWTAKQVTPPKPQTYKVTFTRGGEPLGIESQQVTAGQKATKPQDPTDATKTFMYWADEEGEKFDFDTPITGDVVLEAVFHIVVSFEVGEGATGTAPASISNKTFLRPVALPEKTADMAKEGFVFAGWSDGENTYKAGEDYTPAHSVVFVAVWEEETNDLTVTFDPNNTDNPQTWTVKVAVGEKVARPATDPSIEGGKLFRYWEDEKGAEYDFETPVTANITLTAKFGYRITFSLGEGVEGVAPETIWTGYATTLPSSAPVREGYTFKGWTNGTEVYASGQRIVGKSLELTAIWEDDNAVPPVQTYTVTFRKANTWDTDILDKITGEIPVMENQEAGAKFKLPANPFSYQYYAFAGWSDGTDIYQPDEEYTMPAKNVAFRAEWTAVFAEQYTEDRAGYILLPDTRDGSYTDGKFDYYDESLDVSGEADPFVEVIFSYTIEGDKLNITAPFTAEGNLKDGGFNITINYKGNSYVFGTPDLVEPTVTFDCNGGTGTDPVCTPEYNSNSGMYKIVLPENTYTAPEGKTFKCWSIGEKEYKAGTSYLANPGEAVTIKAVWEEVVVVEPSIPEGTVFEGSCTVPTKSIFGQTTGGETYVKFIVNFEEIKVTYCLSDGTEKTVSATDSSSSNWKPENYGNDAFYFEVKMENVNYYLLVKSDKTKLYICNSDDELLENGEFSARAEDSEWETINTAEGSDFYTLCSDSKKLYFTESFNCGNTTFLGIQFYKNSLGLAVKTIYVSNGAEKILTSSVGFSGADAENGSLLVFTSNSYEIKLGKKSDGKYYVTSFTYKTTDTTERELSGTTAPAF